MNLKIGKFFKNERKYMLTFRTFGMLVAIGIVILINSTAMAKGNGNKPTDSLTTQEIEDLVHLREEEKLARDVYRYLYDVWGQWIFANIAASEQQHMDAVKKLLDGYGIKDPVKDDIEGVFVNDDLKALYDYLVATGESTQLDALWVGATIEDMDIFDIKHMRDNTDKSDLVSVYESLMKGSGNHLRSFCSQLELSGETYEAQYLEQSEVDSILNTVKETGSK